MDEVECIFCQIVAGEAPARIVFEDDHIMAFHDINPAAPTHVLIIPKKHVPRVSDFDPEDQRLIGHMVLTANAIAEEENMPSYRYVVNCGPDALQSVYHVHLHLIGGRPFTWPPG